MTQIPDTELAWAAGFFDGEGYVGVSGAGTDNHRPRVTVTNCDPRPVEKFKRMFGGSISVVDSSKYNPNARTRYTWEITGKAVADVLRAFLPLLVCKREQAELALEFAATMSRGKRKPVEVLLRRLEIDDQLRALKTEVREPTKENVNGGI